MCSCFNSITISVQPSITPSAPLSLRSSIIRKNKKYFSSLTRKLHSSKLCLTYKGIFLMKDKTFKVGRNDPCPCGSGLKFKKCCLGIDGLEPINLKKLYAQKYKIRLKQDKDIEGIKKAGRLVVDTLNLVEDDGPDGHNRHKNRR